jgi:hypothetical protein
MSSAPSTGSTTAPAATPATTESAPPSTAAPSTEPSRNTTYVPAAKKQKDFTPRQNMTSSSGRSNPGLSMLFSGVSDFTFNGIKHNETTFIVPCFIQFFYVLSLMDTQMVHTKRFTDANADWHPFVSQLYFAILTFYTVLKNQRIGGSISHEQSLFVEFLDVQFKAEHLKVPGPLVIFFQALAANAGPTENLGNVVFDIPNQPGVKQRDHFKFANNLYIHLANPIFILDQFMRIIQDIAPAAAAPNAITQASTDRVYLNVFGTAAAAAAANRSTMLTPSARNEVQVTTSLLNGLASSSNIWRNTLPFDPATNTSTYTTGNGAANLSLDQILGFRGFGATSASYYDWFSQVARIMQPYGDFFKDTVSLGSITTSGIGISYIRTEFQTDNRTPDTLLHEIDTRDVRYQPAGTPRYQIPNYTGVVTTHQHSEDYLDVVTEQAGILVQLNVAWETVNADAAAIYVGPLRADILAGPLDLRLDTRKTTKLVVANTIPTIVSGYYHTPSALRFE